MENSINPIPSETTIVNVHLGEVSMSEEEQQKHELLKRDEKKLDKAIEKAIEKPLINKFNVFDKILPKGYGQRIARITNAGITERFDCMASLVSYADQDDQLTDYAKKFVHLLEDAFADAVCINGPSIRLMNLIATEPNLGKIVESKHRVSRMYDDLYMINHRLQLSTVRPEYLPTFCTSMTMCFGWKHMYYESLFSAQTGHKYVTGRYFTALLAKFARSLHPSDYVNMWFVEMVMKNLSVCSLVKKDVIEANPQLMDYAKNFFEVLDAMLVMSKHKLIIRPRPEEETPDINDNVVDTDQITTTEEEL